MRPLSEDLVSFSSVKGKRLFKEAMIEGNMDNYFPLGEQFTTQAEPAYCGPASLTMVLNTLNVDPKRPWKGVWRWFNEEVLQCTTKELLEKGLNLDEMTILARCNGLHTQTFRASKDLSPSERLL